MFFRSTTLRTVIQHMVLIGLGVVSTVAQAQIYRYIDRENNMIYYSNVRALAAPPAGVGHAAVSTRRATPHVQERARSRAAIRHASQSNPIRKVSKVDACTPPQFPRVTLAKH